MQVIGRTKEEVVGKEYFTGFIPESDRDALTGLFGTVGLSPKTVRLETRLIAADGQMRLIEWHGRAVPDSEGLSKVICCVGTDITERRRSKEELLQTRDYLENVLENSPDAIGIVDPKGRFIKWNHTAAELYGYSHDEFRGRNAFNWYADKDELAVMLTALRKQGFVKNYEIGMKKKDGTIIPFDVSISVLKDKSGSVIGSVSVARNLSGIKKALHAIETANSKLREEMEKRRQALDALEKSQSECRTIFENTGNATIIIGEDSTICWANAEFAGISGYAKEEIEGRKSWTEFFLDKHQALMKEYHRLRRIDPSAAPRNYEASLKNSQGHSRDMFLTVAVIPGSQKTVASLLDITERKHAELELRRSHEELEQRSYEISLLNEMLNMRETLRVQSIRDPLTGLFNRRFMEESLTRELSRAKRHASTLSIIMMDLDHFKNFNDTQGHEAGDLLLAATGGLLKKSVRGEDVVCRYGGEEFLIILVGASREDAANRAEYIRNQIKKIKIMHHGKQLRPLQLRSE